MRPAWNIEGRLAAIAASAKVDCYLLDAVDNSSVDVKSPQEAIGLPSRMLMHGESLNTIKKKVKEFCEQTGRDIKDCPLNYKEFQVILKRVAEFQQAKRINKSTWQASDTGYRFNAASPGYSAELVCNTEGKRLSIKHKGEEILSKPVREDISIQLPDLLQRAAKLSFDTIRTHREANPRNLGNAAELSEKQLALFCRMYRTTPDKVDRMSKETIARLKGAMFEKLNGRLTS